MTLPFGFELSHSLQIDLNSTKVQSFSLDLKFLRAHFSAKVWAFSQSERSSLNVESWRLKLSILSLNCATRLSVMSWSHLLLMRSICCVSDAVGHAGLTNLLRSDNLALKLFVTVPFSWLLAIAKWWMPWMMRNNVLTVCAKFWSWEVLSEGPGFYRFEPRFFMPMIWELPEFWSINYSISYHKRFINVKWKAIDINDMKDHPICG